MKSNSIERMVFVCVSAFVLESVVCVFCRCRVVVEVVSFILRHSGTIYLLAMLSYIQRA